MTTEERNIKLIDRYYDLTQGTLLSDTKIKEIISKEFRIKTRTSVVIIRAHLYNKHGGVMAYKSKRDLTIKKDYQAMEADPNVPKKSYLRTLSDKYGLCEDTIRRIVTFQYDPERFEKNVFKLAVKGKRDALIKKEYEEMIAAGEEDSEKCIYNLSKKHNLSLSVVSRVVKGRYPSALQGRTDILDVGYQPKEFIKVPAYSKKRKINRCAARNASIIQAYAKMLGEGEELDACRYTLATKYSLTISTIRKIISESYREKSYRDIVVAETKTPDSTIKEIPIEEVPKIANFKVSLEPKETRHNPTWFKKVDNSARDANIRKEYHELVKEKRLQSKYATQLLQDKFNLGFSTIQSIAHSYGEYSKNKKISDDVAKINVDNSVRDANIIKEYNKMVREEHLQRDYVLDTLSDKYKLGTFQIRSIATLKRKSYKKIRGDNSVRDAIIRKEYHELVKEKRLQSKYATQLLQDKFNLGYPTIRAIALSEGYYSKKKKSSALISKTKVDNSVRDANIRKEYNKMVEEERLKATYAMHTIGDKYNLGFSTIRSIIYYRKQDYKKKKASIPKKTYLDAPVVAEQPEQKATTFFGSLKKLASKLIKHD